MSSLARKLAALHRTLFPYFLRTAKTDANVEAPMLAQVAVFGLPINMLSRSFGMI
jgi:hypothetical protein